MRVGDSIAFYELKAAIATGGFGNVWLVAVDREYYAMKLEPLSATRQTLKFEINILKRLQGNDKFPMLVLDGQDKGYVYCVMELFGPSLDRIVPRLPSGRIAPQFIPTLTVELLNILEQFHAKGYVHRDIKPGNFVTRFRGTSPLALIDFGVSKVYVDSRTGALLDQKEWGFAIGSPLYASPNVHKHLDLSRRDDLYSLMYSIIDMTGVRLPWKGHNYEPDVARMKAENPLSALMAPLGPGYEEMGRHIEALEFASPPDYQLLKTLAIRDAQPPPVMFQWMGLKPANGKITKMAAKVKNAFDPTGFLLEGAPYIAQEAQKSCQML
jgi:serine/threonine protein kinase